MNFVTGGKTEELVSAPAAVQPAVSKALIENDPIKLLEDRKKKEAEEAAKLATEKQSQRLERLARKPGAPGPGRSGTILTSPLGVPASASPIARKTILGG